MTEEHTLAIRPEQPEDAHAIAALLQAAFDGPMEANLVERLRADGDLVLALVALEGADVVGYVAWPRLTLETSQGRRPAVALAPLAVTPSRHGNGIGSALVRTGLDRLRAAGETLVFVLGDPEYYRRFGFSLKIARLFESIYTGAHFMALRLDSGAPERGRLRYPAPFDSLT